MYNLENVINEVIRIPLQQNGKCFIFIQKSKMKEEKIAIPHEFICPIEQVIMKDPVLTVDGSSFNRKAIEEWFIRGHKTNPLTGIVLNNTTLIPNRPLKQLITEFLEKYPNIEKKDVPKNLVIFAEQLDRWKKQFKDKKGSILGHVRQYDNGYYIPQNRRSGKRSGRGIYIWSDGSSYQGEWLDDFKHGMGLYKWSNGETYEGEYIHDERSGYGVAVYLDGSKYEGEWQNDAKNGFGIYSYADGSRYEGFWKNDQKHGKGAMFPKNGRKTEGQWKNGQEVKNCNLI